MDLIGVFLSEFYTKKLFPEENIIHSQNMEAVFNHLETIEEGHDDITPPSSPASPPKSPAPPSSPLWTQQEFNFYHNQLQNQISQLEQIVIGPHVIIIHGIEHLRPHTGQNWRDKLNYLLFESRIPLFWVLDCVPDQDDEDQEFDDKNPFLTSTHDNPSRVRMYLIGHHVKNKIFDILTNFLQHEYNNIVYLE